jgi:transmembrane sensor
VALLEKNDISAAPVAPAEISRELAWQRGHLAFEGEPLGQAAAEFSRYSDIKIVVADPGLAQEEIAGLFPANDPVGFAQIIAVSLNARVEIGDGEVRLSRFDTPQK